MFYQFFLSPQVKRWAIITYTHCIGDLSHELPNNLRLRKLGSIRKVSKRHRITAQSPAPPPPHPLTTKMKIANAGKKLRKIETKPFQQCTISHEN